ncbi:MAG TPA: alpha/beta fold hydrolase, partial [bacterium]|nr:alpha/beta fold hydrolase [bacterium]
MTATLDAQGIRLHRAGMGPAVVLLHPLGVDHRLWDFTVSRLQGRHTLLRYDFPGHGETPVPARGYGIPELSAQLGVVLAREGLAHAAVVGMSLGGLVAQHYAASAPLQVEKLVLVDTTPRYTDEMRGM